MAVRSDSESYNVPVYIASSNRVEGYIRTTTNCATLVDFAERMEAYMLLGIAGIVFKISL